MAVTAFPLGPGNGFDGECEVTCPYVVVKPQLQQRKAVAEQVEGILDAHPLAGVLTSMPGIGVRTAARILLEGDASNFASSGHLAAYAGIAPVTRSSGSSIRGEHPARTGNRKLKRAFFLAAFAALHDPTSRAYYDRKVRHEALDVRVEVRDLRRPAVAAAGVKLGAA